MHQHEVCSQFIRFSYIPHLYICAVLSDSDVMNDYHVTIFQT